MSRTPLYKPSEKTKAQLRYEEWVSKKKAAKQLSDEVRKDMAFVSYMRGASNEEIRKELGLETSGMVSVWAKEYGWKEERERIRKEIIQHSLDKYNAKRKEILPTILGASYELILGALQHRAKQAQEGEPVKLSEAKAIAEIVGNLDKLHRLDNNEATDIVEERAKTITIEDLKKAVKRDYFIDVDTDGPPEILSPNQAIERSENASTNPRTD